MMLVGLLVVLEACVVTKYGGRGYLKTWMMTQLRQVRNQYQSSRQCRCVQRRKSQRGERV